MRAFLDTRRRVADDVLELCFEVHQYLFDAFLGQCVLVAGLAGGKYVQVLKALVLDQGLLQVGFAVDHVDEVVNHAALAAHDQVEVTQAHVEVDDDRLVAAQCEAGADGGAGGGLAHTPLAGSNDENLGQGVSPLNKSGQASQQNAKKRQQVKKLL
ncbi:hypothetical protein D3C78_1413620 [compost metagenome]